MSDQPTSLLVERLRADAAPQIDAASLVTAATTAGRRRVRRRQGIAGLAAVVALASVGTTWALTAPDVERGGSLVATNGDDSQDDAKNDAQEDANDQAPPYALDSFGVRQPLPGSQHHRVIAELSGRTTVHLTPVPMDIESITGGSELAPEHQAFLTREPTNSNFRIDGFPTLVQYGWGVDDEYSPAQAQEANDLGLDSGAVATPFPDGPLEQCRDLVERADGPRGTCTLEEDGRAYAVYDFTDPEWGPHQRRVMVFHPDNWHMLIDVHHGGRATQEEPGVVLDEADMPTLDEMTTWLRDGRWFQ